MVARLVVDEHASRVQRELISLRAKRANYVFRGTTEVQGALKLSATHDFTWWRVSNCQATNELSKRVNCQRRGEDEAQTRNHPVNRTG